MSANFASNRGVPGDEREFGRRIFVRMFAAPADSRQLCCLAGLEPRHRRMPVAAIKAHDAELADARMRSHLDQVAKLYWKARRAAK